MFRSLSSTWNGVRNDVMRNWMVYAGSSFASKLRLSMSGVDLKELVLCVGEKRFDPFMTKYRE